MRAVPSWDEYFMSVADAVAKRSKDPSTQVGAVIVGPNNNILSTGYNGMAPNTHEDESTWARPYKYDFVIHAEMNAIAHAAKAGHSLQGSTLYVTHFPCNKTGCARLIVAAGIWRVVSGPPPSQIWVDDSELTKQLFDKANVRFEIYQPNADI